MTVSNGLPERGAGQRGMALAIVLWFIAGMSLLVAGTVLTARTDTRLAQVHVERAKVAAAGDGAINLLMADVYEGRFAADLNGGVPQGQYVLGEARVSVVAIPVERLLELNSATPAALASTLRFAGAAAGPKALELASAVVQWRTGGEGRRPQRLEALEDLLGAPGFTRAHWDATRDFVAVNPFGAGAAQAGPRLQQSLQWLSQMNPPARSQRADLLAADSPLDFAGGASRFYRVDALMEVGGKPWLRRRWISFSSARGSLPWAAMRTEPARIVTGAGTTGGQG